MKVKILCGILITFLILPVFITYAIEYTFQRSNNVSDVSFSPDMIYYNDYRCEEMIDSVVYAGSGQYLFTNDHPLNRQETSLMLILDFSNKFYNLREFSINMTFSDVDSSYKLFRMVKFGIGTKSSMFVNVSKIDDVLVHSSGKTITFDFGLRDYIQNKERSAEYLAIVFYMYDNGNALNYFDVGDTLTFDITAKTTELDRYFGLYKNCMLFISIALIAVVTKFIFIEVKPGDVIF